MISVLCVTLVLLKVLAVEPVVVQLVLGILCCISVLYLLVQLLKEKQRSDVGLELDQEGFLFRASPMGRKIGKIKWQDVRIIQTGTADGKKQLLIKFASNKRLTIDDNRLHASFYEMETQVLYFYHQYHNGQIGMHKTEN